MWSKVCIMLLALLFSSPARGEDPAAQFTFLDVSQPAPFAGTLFNPTATAYILVNPEFMRGEFDLELEFQLDLQMTEHHLLLTNVNIKYDALSAEYKLTVGALEQRNSSLEQALLARSPDNKMWWFIGGTATGAVIATGIIYAVLSASSGAQQ